VAHVILVRHAQPVIEPDKPSETWGLSDDGRAATAALAHALMNFAPGAILCGAEPKMTGTAAVLSEQIDLPVQRLPGLSEHARRSAKFGDKAVFEAAIKSLFERPHETVYGEESADQTYARFAAALDGELAARKGETIVAVSGGTAICIFLARRSGIDAFATWKTLRLPMAFVLDSASWQIESVI
jgi:broad specificity phosphatase PhoE